MFYIIFLLSIVIGFIVSNFWFGIISFFAMIAGYVYLSKKSEISDKSKNHFLFAIFAMLAKFAKADGIISKEEIIVVQNFIKQIGLKGAAKEYAKQIFNEAKNDAHDIYYYADKFISNNKNEEIRVILYQVLCQIAIADGILHASERKILQKITSNLKINSNYYKIFIDAVNQSNVNDIQNEDLQKYYTLLESNISATDSEIKTSYKKKIKQYHPDKLASKNLPNEFMQFAEKQTQLINEAYNKIKKHRGM